jgi:hypothetical protein
MKMEMKKNNRERYNNNKSNKKSFVNSHAYYFAGHFLCACFRALCTYLEAFEFFLFLHTCFFIACQKSYLHKRVAHERLKSEEIYIFCFISN